MLEGILPFLLKKYNNSLVQTHTLIGQNSVLKKDNVENILDKVKWQCPIKNRNTKSQIAEIIANEMFEETMKFHLRRMPMYEGKIIRGKQDFIINSNGNYIAKLNGGERVFILKNKKSNDNFEDDPKFGISNEAELDGLYILKRKFKGNNRKCLFAMETKTGDAKLNSQHIINVTNRLSSLWGFQSHYVLVGFRDELYSKRFKENDDERKINYLKRGLEEVYYKLKNHGVEFIPIHFPFSKSEFDFHIKRIDEERTGVLSCDARYDSGSGYMEIKDRWGNVQKGTFIPEN